MKLKEKADKSSYLETEQRNEAKTERDRREEETQRAGGPFSFFSSYI